MNKKKKIVLVIVILLLICTAIGLIFINSEKSTEKEFVSSFVYNSDFKQKSYNFYTPDYDADIMNDPEYLKYDHEYIAYTSDGITQYITNEDFPEFGPVVQFFGKYFDAVKAGDEQIYNALHSERYFKHNRAGEMMAPQRLYDIKLEYIAEAKVNDPLYKEVTKFIYKVSYKIVKNDGTFRSDIPSDAARPLYLELVYNGSDLFIDACGDKCPDITEIK